MKCNLSVSDFPVGCVDITVYCGALAIGKAHLQYYNTMEEIGHLLAKVADPVDFMCQVGTSTDCIHVYAVYWLHYVSKNVNVAH